jgi:hypothetical protein
MSPLAARLLLLCVVPLAAVGPALLPGHRLLPLRPATLEPLASEAPRPVPHHDHAPAPNRLAVDALFPLLSDRLEIRERVLSGELPLWDARLGLGAPLLGGTMAGPLYPPGLLRILLPPDLAAGWHALLALFLAGAGLWLLGERRGLAPGACAIGAMALQAGAWGLANLHLAPKVDAALWLPWSLWAVDGVLERRRGAELALTLSVAFSFLAGFPGVAAFGAVATLAYALVRSPGRQRGPAPLARALLFVLLGVTGAAAQLLPTAAASASSPRGPLEATEVASQALPVGTSLGLVLPHLAGDPRAELGADRDPLTWTLTRRSEAAQAEQANALEWDLFAGVGVLLLGLAALVARPRQAAFPALLGLAAVGFAQGWPGLSLLYHVPGLNLGNPARAVSLAWVAWPWLAAVGAQALLEGAARARPAALVAALLAGGAAAAARWVVDLQAWVDEVPALLAARFGVPQSEVLARVAVDAARGSAERVDRGILHVAAFAAAGLLAVLLAARRRLGIVRPVTGPWIALAALVAVEGLLVGWPHVVPRALAEGEQVFPRSEAMTAVKAAASDGRVLRLDTSESGVADVLVLARPNLPHVWGIADLTPYVAFPDRRTVELLEAMDPRTRYRTGASRLPDARLIGHPVLDLLRVTAILSREPVEHPRLEPVLEREGFHVYRRLGAPPPAWVVPAAIEAPSDSTALGLLASRTVDPAQAVVLTHEPDAAAPPALPEEFVAGTVVVRRPRPEELELDVRGSSGGWLVLSEAWDPGWSARVDGERARLLRADHALRALRIPAGDCAVRLAYRPPAFRLGAALSVLALLAALVLTLRSPGRESARPRPGPDRPRRRAGPGPVL